jgi:hypothetical protein
VQLSAATPQSTHVAPAAPHVLADRRLHVAPEQQPLAQDLSSQTHRPPLHRWPPVHAAPPPHAQSPAAEQVSPSPALQSAHALPD